MNRGRIRALALIVTGIALSGVLIVLTYAGPISADVPWPTPPPGPRPPVPKVIGLDNIKPPGNVPLGATSSVILPLWMPAPRFPPVPKFTPVKSPDGVRIISDAGSILETVQLVYLPLGEDGPTTGPNQVLKMVFDLSAYDHQGNPISLDLRRPWVLEVPIQRLIKGFEDPARFLIARYEGNKGWMPLVTSYHRNRGILQARLLKVGLFAVLFEPRDISG